MMPNAEFAGKKVRGRPFQPGNKFGLGRPKGSRNKPKPGQTLIDQYSEHVVRKCLALAMQGDRGAIRLCMERISPARRGTLIRINLPKIKTAEDVNQAAEKLTTSIQRGELTPTDGNVMMSILESRSQIIERVQLQNRLEKID